MYSPFPLRCMPNDSSKRLLSLDLLRGFDMACLVLICPVVIRTLYVINPDQDCFLGHLALQLDHTPWEGFTFMDIIMPLFLFMSGITIPFSMSKYKKGTVEADHRFFFRILKRVAVLWVVGMVVQGNLLAFDIHTLKLFSNTLQSIAVGYAVVAVLYVFTSLRTQFVVVMLCFLAFFVVFAVSGDLSCPVGTNIAERIDRAVLGHFQDGVNWTDGHYVPSADYHYTWILSSLNFIVTVYLGCLAGYILKGEGSQSAKLRKLLLWGVVMVATGLALSPLMPIVKHLWTSSMTLFSGGLCFLLMALFYYVFDMRHWTRGLMWLRFYGMNSLVAYFLGEYVRFDSFIDSFLFGFKQWVGEGYIILSSVANGAIIFGILMLMFRMKVFVKA